MKKSFTFVASILALVLFCTTSCSAFRREGRTRAHTLMVTGNYMNARLLCDLAQYKSKQPILLFSSDDTGNQQIFFLPASSKVQQIDENDFLDIISFVNPRRIAIVGDERYVPKTYVDQIREKFPAMVFKSQDWEQNARMLGELLNQRTLQKDFVDSKTRLSKAGIDSK